MTFSADKINKKQLGLLLLIGAAYLIHYLFNPAPATRINATALLEELRSKPLVYTKHGSCRMECRQISEREIKDLLENGKHNPTDSDPDDKPCPSYAIEGWTEDGQEIRVIFANCDRQTKVVTAIDLNNNYNCDCR